MTTITAIAEVHADSCRITSGVMAAVLLKTLKIISVNRAVARVYGLVDFNKSSRVYFPILVPVFDVVAAFSTLRNRRISGRAIKNIVAHDAAITDMLSSSFSVIAETLLDLVLAFFQEAWLARSRSERGERF